MQQQQKHPLFVAIALMFSLAMIGAACSSSDAAANDETNTDQIAAFGDDGTDDDGTNGDEASSADDESSPPAANTDPPESGLVLELGQVIARGRLTAEAGDCLVAESEAAGDFTIAMNQAIDAEAPLTEDGFTSIVLAVRECAGQTVLSEAAAEVIAQGVEAPELATCLDSEAASDTSDSGAVGIAALAVGFPVPVITQAGTLQTLANCVTDDIIAGQIATQVEQSRNFSVTVDPTCVEEALADADLSTFFDAQVVGGQTDGFDEIFALAETCIDDPFEGMLTEIPDDFVPWAGTGGLSEVAPPARNGAYNEAPPMNIDPAGSYQAILTTTDGEIVIDLFAAESPETVNNFVNLARDGYFDGTVFHRVLVDFMAQAGDPTGTGTGGPGYQFGDEVDNGLTFDRRGLIAMANAGPGTNGSQFFITLAPTDFLDGLHTIFGEVAEGDETLGAVDLRDPAAPTGRGELIISIAIVEG